MKYNICAAQSGSPTAAVNSSLAGIFRCAAGCPGTDGIYGAVNGIEGLINDELADLRKIITSEHDLKLLGNTPSTVLGSCRYKLPDKNRDENAYIKIINTLEKHEIKAFFYIGGSDSMDTAMKLDDYCKAVGKDIKIIGIPKSVDNNIAVTDHTPGFGSAAKYVAAALQEIIRDSRVYSIQSITIAEIMGFETGWLAASSCVLHSQGEPAPHLIYLPESDFSEEKFICDISDAIRKYRAVTVAVSEGTAGGKYPGGIAKHLEKIAADNFGCKVRSVELNVMQRCSAHLASLTDLREAEQIGAEAVKAAADGESGKMMIFRRLSSEPYRCSVESVPIELCANKGKPFPKDWINHEGNNITADAYNYFLPLIQGEPEIEYRMGIPVHFRINQ